MSFSLTPISISHLVVAWSQIKLGEVLGIAQVVKQIHNQQNGVDVAHRYFFKGSVIDAQPQASVMIFLK